MRKLLFMICVLGTVQTSWAQPNKASWANLSVLQAGQKIQVSDMNSQKRSGTFVNVSETAITLQATAGEQTVQRQDVRSVKLMENKHRMRNTLLGAAVGGGAGAGIGAASFHPCSSQSFCIDPDGRAIRTGVGAVIGVAGGAVVGALLPSHSMIYNVNSR